MKVKPNLISINGTSAFRLDPTLTNEEAIVLRALAVGQIDKQMCTELHLDPTIFLRMMREMREKIGMADNVSLIEWAKDQIKGLDQRIDKPERCARLA